MYFVYIANCRTIFILICIFWNFILQIAEQSRLWPRYIHKWIPEKQCFGNQKITCWNSDILLLLIMIIYRYLSITTDVLTSVKKMEESLKRLKKAKSTQSLSSSVSSSANLGALSDDDKIRLQLFLDVTEFGNQVRELVRWSSMIRSLNTKWFHKKVHIKDRCPPSQCPCRRGFTVQWFLSQVTRLVFLSWNFFGVPGLHARPTPGPPKNNSKLKISLSVCFHILVIIYRGSKTGFLINQGQPPPPPPPNSRT